MAFLGYIGMILAGFSLGLLGGGGAILVVPILVYLLSVPANLATGYSLFIVGATSLLGVYRYAATREIDYRVALIFALPSIIGVMLARKFVLQWLPDVIFDFGSIKVTKDLVIMVVFSVIMVLAARAMILRGRKEIHENLIDEVQIKIPSLLIKGFGVGIISGFVGAGGGFLIIPTLVVLAGLPMRRAVATSLLIITINSFFGFAANLGSESSFDLTLLTLVTSLAGIGIVFGMKIGQRISGKKLEPAFGWFILAMGSFVLLRQIADLKG